ncbi:MAG TPA: AMP-binding protein [Steroidobacter sp.]
MNMPWLKHYPPGTPGVIELDSRQTLVDMFQASCARHSARPAFHNWGTTLTYSELEQRSRAFAAWLMTHGFRKGERIALMLPNVLQYPVAMFGALRAGLVVVNTNPLYTPRELEHQLRDSGATCIVVLANFAHVVERVLAHTDIRTVITTELGDLLHFPKGTAISWAARHLRHLVPDYHIPGAVPFRQTLELGARLKFGSPSIAADDLAFLQYTGGTTGVAKGAMLTHHNLMANLEQVSTLWRSYIRDGEEIVITPLPLYHVFCLTCNCLTFFKHGGLNVLITNPRDIPAFVAELNRWPFTTISGVNTLYKALLEHPRFAHVNFSKLKLAVAGGMALHPDVAGRWKNLTGNTLIEGYGLTEASPIVACNLPEASRLGSVGVPLPSTEISIRDDGREVEQGQSGELYVRGPQVMLGYWHMPEETAQTLDKDGWLRTGDVATLDAEGFVHIVDRKKDMIVVSGFKVFPNEIEAVLTMHESISEAGCIGVPDDRSGQAVKAFVVTHSELNTEQIIAFCRERLTPYKVPKYVEFRATLPKTNIGKILRRALVEETSKDSHGATGTIDH